MQNTRGPTRLVASEVIVGQPDYGSNLRRMRSTAGAGNILPPRMREDKNRSAGPSVIKPSRRIRAWICQIGGAFSARCSGAERPVQRCDESWLLWHGIRSSGHAGYKMPPVGARRVESRGMQRFESQSDSR